MESSSRMVGAEIAKKLLYLLFTKLFDVFKDFDLFLPGLDEPADKFNSLFTSFYGLVLLLL